MAPPPQGGGQSDNSMSMLWSIAALFAFVSVVGWYTQDYLKIFYLSLKLYEVSFLNLISGGHFEQMHSAILYALTNYKSIGPYDLLSIGHLVGAYLKYPFAILLVALGFIVYLGNSARSFRSTYSMSDFAKLEANNWPQISPVLKMNLLKADIDKGPWAMAMSPMQFCKHHRLIDEVKPARKEGMARKDWDKVEALLRRGDANRLFSLQLGPLWRGTKFLPIYARALFAAFAARINADTKAAEKLLFQLNKSCTTGKFDTRGMDDLLKKHENTKLVQKVVQGHAYVLTVMAAMLEGAREDGVQASADFLWLKPVDRRLWYTLNTVGRQTPFAEVAGVFAHWVAEKEAARKIIVPMVEEATKALEIALKEVIYKRDEAP